MPLEGAKSTRLPKDPVPACIDIESRLWLDFRLESHFRQIEDFPSIRTLGRCQSLRNAKPIDPQETIAIFLQLGAELSSGEGAEGGQLN
jgi:hypothetical protein